MWEIVGPRCWQVFGLSAGEMKLSPGSPWHLSPLKDCAERQLRLPSRSLPARRGPHSALKRIAARGPRVTSVSEQCTSTFHHETHCHNTTQVRNLAGWPAVEVSLCGIRPERPFFTAEHLPLSPSGVHWFPISTGDLDLAVALIPSPIDRNTRVCVWGVQSGASTKATATTFFDGKAPLMPLGWLDWHFAASVCVPGVMIVV